MSNIKVGVLYLQSKQYNEMSRDFIRGLKLNNSPVTFTMESIGIGANDRQIIEKIEKLHYQEDINIIIGFFGHYNIRSVYEHATNNEILLIASDLGATMPYDIGKHEGVFINSYGLNESCYLLGQYFAKNKINNIATSSSYYDAGYGMLAAMEMALKENNLTFSGHYITPFQPRENEGFLMNQAISSTEADTVFGFHSGLYAKEHADFISQTNLLNEFTYYLTPFSVKKDVYHDKQNPIFIVGSWLGNDNENTNSQFIREYKEEYNSTPTVFSLLGYENALVLKTIIKSENLDNSYTSLLNKMKKLHLEGPRGTIFFEEKSNRTIFNHYLYKMLTYDESDFSYQKVETLENYGSFIQNVLFQESPAQPGGWQNAYLCH